MSFSLLERSKPLWYLPVFASIKNDDVMAIAEVNSDIPTNIIIIATIRPPSVTG